MCLQVVLRFGLTVVGQCHHRVVVRLCVRHESGALCGGIIWHFAGQQSHGPQTQSHGPWIGRRPNPTVVNSKKRKSFVYVVLVKGNPVGRHFVSIPIAAYSAEYFSCS